MLTAQKPVDERKADGYEECGDEVYSMLARLIGKHNLPYQNVAFKLFYLTKEKKTKGKKVLGSCKVLGKLDFLLSGVDVVIMIDQGFWLDCPDRREPLLYHELCHLFMDADGKLSTVDHDFTGFISELREYGDWTEEMKPVQLALMDFNLKAVPEGEED